MSAYLRTMRTTQERRRWFRDVEEKAEWPELRIRQRRSFKLLPDAWDDLGRSDWKHGTWKRHRKTKYRMKKSGRSGRHPINKC